MTSARQVVLASGMLSGCLSVPPPSGIEDADSGPGDSPDGALLEGCALVERFDSNSAIADWTAEPDDLYCLIEVEGERLELSNPVGLAARCGLISPLEFSLSEHAAHIDLVDPGIGLDATFSLVFPATGRSVYMSRRADKFDVGLCDAADVCESLGSEVFTATWHRFLRVRDNGGLTAALDTWKDDHWDAMAMIELDASELSQAQVSIGTFESTGQAGAVAFDDLLLCPPRDPPFAAAQ